MKSTITLKITLLKHNLLDNNNNLCHSLQWVTISLESHNLTRKQHNLKLERDWN